jgi:hypothetical protein
MYCSIHRVPCRRSQRPTEPPPSALGAGDTRDLLLRLAGALRDDRVGEAEAPCRVDGARAEQFPAMLVVHGRSRRMRQQAGPSVGDTTSRLPS